MKSTPIGLTAAAMTLFALLIMESETCSADPAVPPSPEVKKNSPTQGLDGMVYVKGGCYDMGDLTGDGAASSKPSHSVCLKDFYLDSADVTLQEFRKFVEETHYLTEAETPYGDDKRILGSVGWNGKEYKVDAAINWKNPGFKQGENHPVVCVSWNDAQKYAEWKGRTTGNTFRLPTEAEWEYAARSGGKKVNYSWGNELPPKGNVGDITFKKKAPSEPALEKYNDGYPFTSPVRKFKPNKLGLFDMTGNVWQWVQDWYDPEYYKNSPKDNPTGPEKADMKVLRGGSWGNGVPAQFLTTYRGYFFADTRSSFLGFRLAADIKQPR